MPSGMFIKLSNGIEGFVALRVMDDYYAYDENLLTFIGNRGKKYRLGDEIRAKLLDVDLQSKKMDFMIVEKAKKPATKTHVSPKKKGQRRV